MSRAEAVVVGSGPNGLAAAIALQSEGIQTLLLEGRETVGGGLRTGWLTREGFRHDICSAAHPFGILSPYFKQLPLEEHGLTWAQGAASYAHPLDDGPAAVAFPDLQRTADQLGVDRTRYERLVSPFVERSELLFENVLKPLSLPSAPFLMARFGLVGLRSSKSLAARFTDERARALVAGCAAHSVLPLDKLTTAAVAMMFLVSGHVTSWPVVTGGTQNLADALTAYFASLGGQVETGRMIHRLDELPEARAYLFDTSPAQLANIAENALPSRYVRKLREYRYGSGVFKVDWALSGSIPWNDSRCRDASTVHVGGTFEEIAAAEDEVWRGGHPDRPFVMVCQQSELDATRAPDGMQTGYAYCHVPHGSTVDQTDVIEAQIERFAPGFRDLILDRHTMNTAEFEAHNPNYLGGAITGGVADIKQLFTRPVARLNPYSTPNPKLWICSSSSPPGGGVHGMCGYYAARGVLRRLGKFPRALPV